MMLSRAIRNLARRLSGERGFTMVSAMGSLMLVMLFSAGAYTAVTGDIPLARADQDRKQAYAAAEAGLHEYEYHLNQDNAYWSKCTNVPAPNAVNQRWDGTGSDPRQWRKVPNASSEYAIELLPATGYSQCVEGTQESMIDPASGTFRIRVTGRSNGKKRSIVATMRRRGFLDFLWFTDLETSDPAWYELNSQGRATNPDIVAWAASECAKWYRLGRGSESYSGTVVEFDGTGTDPLSASCTEIQFADADVMAGPFHTNDEILTCGTPEFGRTTADNIEVSAPPQGYRSCGGGSSPVFKGVWSPSSRVMGMPPSNTSLASVADPNWTFTGRTTIVLNGNSMTVNGVSMGLPPNGVVYVKNGNCGQGYFPLNPYGNAVGCADVYLRGNYSGNLTIGSEKDIIVDGNVIHNGDAMLGLISNGFVRVYHPVSPANRVNNPNYTSCSNSAGTMTNVTIDAAILSLQHSFTVDNYYCGPKLGTLTVNGAIGQKHRGPVGRSGSPGNGYTKNYQYDDRLRFRSPPHFLDPVQSSWRVIRQTEQTPPR